MKKTYMAPAVEVIKVDAVNMMATSLGFGSHDVDTSLDGVQLGREMSFGMKDVELLWD